MPTETYKIWMSIKKCTIEDDGEEAFEEAITPVSAPVSFEDLDKAVSLVAILCDLPVEEVMMAPKEPLTVVIEVLGGVATITKQPAGIEVKIIDHDTEE